MIEKANRWPDTAFLRPLPLESGPCMDLSTAPACAIDYKKSWVRALPRMIIGLVAVPFAVYTACSPALFLISSEPVEWVWYFIVLVAASLYFSVFVRPTINREAKLKLRKVLQVGK